MPSSHASVALTQCAAGFFFFYLWDGWYFSALTCMVINLVLFYGILNLLLLLSVRHYEVVYLIQEDHADEVDTVISKVQGTLFLVS